MFGARAIGLAVLSGLARGRCCTHPGRWMVHVDGGVAAIAEEGPSEESRARDEVLAWRA
jgi:hypothetical protein